MAAALIAVAAVAGQNRWTPLGPTNNCRAIIYDLAIDPANPLVFYAGGNETGVWKSSDAGLSWRKTTDRGATWREIADWGSRSR